MIPTHAYHASDVTPTLATLRPGGPGPKGPKALGFWMTSSIHPWQRQYSTRFHRLSLDPAARVLTTTSAVLSDMAARDHGGDFGLLSLRLQETHDLVVMTSPDTDDVELVALRPQAIAAIEPAP